MAKKKGTHERVHVQKAEVEEKKDIPEYAGFGIRFISYMIDAIILFLIGYGIQATLGNDYLSVIFTAKSIDEIVNVSKMNQLGEMISFGFALLYYCLFWLLSGGQTPGKMLMGIRIVKEDNTKLDISTVFLRYVGFMLSSFLMGIAFLWVLFDKKKQALHDKLAKTFVISVSKTKTMGIIVGVLFLVGYIILVGAILQKTYTLVLENSTTNISMERSGIQNKSFFSGLQTAEVETSPFYAEETENTFLQALAIGSSA